ncbi:MAG: hypothetical protein ACKOCW_00165 [Planctomycetaceae bacterium]
MAPERLVERAMTFDADGDGKLDRTELAKFADDLMRMRAQFQGAGGRFPERGNGPPGGGPRGDGFRPRDGAGEPGGQPPQGGERPERPRRPG